MTKALVFITNSRESQWSRILKLYGDPDEYVHKLSNDTYAAQLPIHVNRIRWGEYKYLQYVTLDYNEQRVYFSNNYHGRLEYGLFIYRNRSNSQILNFRLVPTEVTI